MRAVRIVGPGELRLESAPTPEPLPRQIRFRVEGCGVGRASLAAWSGVGSSRYPLRPGEPGCEAWGVVDAVGAEVRHLREGDRVAAVSACSYAELDVADAATALRIPTGLSGLPFPGHTLGGALRIIERSQVGVGQTVGVVGIGFLGALLVRLATLAGAQVIALSRRPFSLALAREMGAVSTVELGDPAQAVSEVEELTRGELCETVIDATTRQAALTLASRLVAARGKLVIAGSVDGKREVDLDIWGKRGLDVINANDARAEARLEGMKAAIEIIETEQLDPRPLYTHVYDLEDTARALEMARARPLGFIKALVRPKPISEFQARHLLAPGSGA